MPLRDKAMSFRRGRARSCAAVYPWTDIEVALLVEHKVFPAERTVLAPRHVFNWNVRRDLLLMDDSIERFG